MEEHLQAKRLIADLLDMSTTDPQWDSKVSVLCEEIRHHVGEEEHELFPKLARMDPDTRRALGHWMVERLEELKQQGHLRDQIPQETEVAAPLG